VWQPPKEPRLPRAQALGLRERRRIENGQNVQRFGWEPGLARHFLGDPMGPRPTPETALRIPVRAAPDSGQTTGASAALP
jgi:hypothetical protein